MRGSVIKRGKTWSYVLYLGRDADGKNARSGSGGFPTRRLADAAAWVDALDRRSKGTWADAGRMTVGEYLDEWLAGIRPTVRDKTAASYEATLHDWVLPRIGSQQLVDLNATRLRALYAEPLDQATRRQGRAPPLLGAVRASHPVHALKDATEARTALAESSVARSRAPRPKREMTVWSAEEARRVPRLARGRPAVRALGPHDHDRRPSRRGARTAVACDLDWPRVGWRSETRACAIGYEVQEAEPKTTAGKRQ